MLLARKLNRWTWIISGAVILLVAGAIHFFTSHNNAADPTIIAFANEVNALTDELVQKVEAGPTPIEGADEAQKYLDSRKADIRARVVAVRNISPNQVSTEAKQRMDDSFYQDGVKLAELRRKYGSDAVVDDRLKKLIQDFLDLLEG
jgi:hypothetical protein